MGCLCGGYVCVGCLCGVCVCDVSVGVCVCVMSLWGESRVTFRVSIYQEGGMFSFS